MNECNLNNNRNQLQQPGVGFDIPGGCMASQLIKREISRIQTELPPPNTFLEPNNLIQVLFRNSQSGNEEEQRLRKLIGKPGEAPSATGLSLEDATVIDPFVKDGMKRWWDSLHAPSASTEHHAHKIIKIDKDVYGLPRSFQIGLETDANGYLVLREDNGQAIMRVMVMLNKTRSASELPYNEDDDLARETVKVDPVGKGGNKEVKAAVDWLTGQRFVRVVAPGPAGAEEVRKEFFFRKLLEGGSGIPKPGFMWYKYRKFDRGGIPIQMNSFFMHQYENNLHDHLKKKNTPLDFPEAISLIIGLADGLISYKQANVIYCDGKLANTLVDDKGKLVFIDNGLSHTLQEYLEAAEKVKICDSTSEYMAPEVINAFGGANIMRDYVAYPFARDMWAAGLQTLFILAAGNKGLTRTIINLASSLSYVLIEMRYIEKLVVTMSDMESKGFQPAAQVLYNNEKMKFEEVHPLAQYDYLLSFDEVFKNMKARSPVLDYNHLDAHIDNVLETIKESLLMGLRAEAAENVAALLEIVRQMLRAKPKDRIVPHMLKTALQLHAVDE